MNAQEILNSAADLLEKDGWCQGYPNNALGQRCALGAIWDVEHYGPEAGQAEDLVRQLITKKRYGGTVSATYPLAISTWNDQPGRTAQEVIAVLREAAQL